MCLVADFKIHNFKGKIEITQIEMETKAFKLRGILKDFYLPYVSIKLVLGVIICFPPPGGIFTMIFLFLYLNS